MKNFVNGFSFNSSSLEYSYKRINKILKTLSKVINVSFPTNSLIKSLNDLPKLSYNS